MEGGGFAPGDAGVVYLVGHLDKSAYHGVAARSGGWGAVRMEIRFWRTHIMINSGLCLKCSLANCNQISSIQLTSK